MEPLSGVQSMDPMGGIILTIIIIAIVLSVTLAIINFVKNATSPLLSVQARIIGKRTKVSSSSHAHSSSGHCSGGSVSTYYYLTFETATGERMELRVSDSEYGLLAEGDTGVLNYQGEWYKGFQRGVTATADESPYA
jgi:hypothetical protein